MKTNRSNIRVLALAGVSAAALIVAAGAAWAAPAPQTNYSLDLTELNTTLATIAQQTQYLITAGLPQLQIGNSTATITGSSVTNVFGAGTGFPAQASNNTFSATAIGLRSTSAAGYDYVANLGAIGNTGTNDGIGILHPQLTGNTGTVAPVVTTASITGAAFTNSLNQFSSGSVDTSGNTLSASTTINQISPDYQVRGTIPTGYSSAVQGSSSANFVTDDLAIVNSASIAITAAQTAYNAGAVSGSRAQIVGGTIGDTIVATTPIVVAAPQTVDGNAVAASFTGNSSHNIFLAEQGDSPTFNGSVLVSNNQANIETGGTGVINAASATNVSIFVNNINPNVAIGGSADVSNNTISVSATGNAAGAGGVNGGLPTIGNAIAFDNGINIDGTGSVAGNSLGIPSSNVLSSELGGDLILGNGQGNQGTDIGSVSSGSTIYVQAADITAAGKVNVSGNAINTAATGNVAVDTIQAQGAASIDATVVAASLQTNDATPIHTAITNDHLGAVPVTGGTDSVANGAIAVTNNAMNASAFGNLAGDPTVRTISLDAANLTSSGGLATVTSSTQWAVAPILSSTGGGISASNMQANFGAETPITATINTSAMGGLLLTGFTNGTLDVKNNTIGASVAGNTGYTSVALTGSNGAFSAGVSNAQYNANPLTAIATGVAIDIFAGAINNSDLVVSDNSLNASGVANSAVNSLSATGFSTLVLGGPTNAWGFPNQSTWYDPGSPATFTNRVVGALALDNNQTNDGNVTAALADSGAAPLDPNGFGFFYTAVGAVTNGSSISITGNSAATSAIGAQATNTLTLSPGTLTTVSGNADQIASLGSIQYQGGTADAGVAISSTISLTGAVIATGVVSSGAVANSPLTVGSNSLSAFAAGNIGTNTLTVTGTNYASGAPSAPLAGVQHLGMRVQAEFALQNGQFDNSPANGDSAGSRTASITDGFVGIALTGSNAITTSPLTVSGNTQDTDARNNYASNSLNLTGFSTLSTSAGVLNFQNSISTVTSTVTEGKIGIDAGGHSSTDSPLTVSDNSSQARAIANTAFNTLAVGSEVLGGNSGNAGASASKPQLPDFVGANPSTITADYAMGSYQGTVESTTASVSGVFQLDLGAGALSGGSATVAGNSMKALAENNNGVNTLNIAAGTTTALSGALMSEQRSIAPTTSATAGYGADLAFGGVQVGSSLNAPISVSGNTLSAVAANNDVTNTLSASATSNLAGAGSIGNATVANTGPVVSVTADYALFNIQDVSQGTTSATANPGQFGVNVNTTTGTSPVTVQNNSVIAQSHVSDANNSLALSGTNVSASGSLGNWQSNANSSTATISGGSMGFTGGGAITTSPLNVSGNSFVASAGGNGATNALNVTATNYTMPINGVASGGTVTGGGYQATAAYAVLNMQQNTGAVTSSVGAAGQGGGLNIGVNMGGGTPSAVSGSPMTVSNNTVMASAYGNNANNTITLSAGIGTLPSASLTSSQVNSGAVTSTVTGANIGINVGANTGSSAVSSNNNVGAISIGNSAGNTIGIR